MMRLEEGGKALKCLSAAVPTECTLRSSGTTEACTNISASQVPSCLHTLVRGQSAGVIRPSFTSRATRSWLDRLQLLLGLWERSTTALWSSYLFFNCRSSRNRAPPPPRRCSPSLGVHALVRDHEPGALLGGVVLLQPGPPGLAVPGLHQGFVLVPGGHVPWSDRYFAHHASQDHPPIRPPRQALPPARKGTRSSPSNGIGGRHRTSVRVRVMRSVLRGSR